MHVLCCYTSLHPATAEALRRYAPGAELVDVSGAPGMYRRVLREHWDIPADLVIIEHDMQVVMDIADRICVLNWGRLIAEGKPLEIRNNVEVIQAYLG